MTILLVIRVDVSALNPNEIEDLRVAMEVQVEDTSAKVKDVEVLMVEDAI